MSSSIPPAVMRIIVVVVTAIVLIQPVAAIQSSNQSPRSTAITDNKRPITSLSASESLSVNNSVTVSGQLLKSNGQPATADLLEFNGKDVDHGDNNVTNDAGEFSVQLIENTTYTIGFWQNHPNTNPDVAYPKDGTVDIQAIGVIDVGTDNITDAGEMLPRGHNLTITVVNQNGDPVQNATVHVASVKGDAYAGVATETTASGDLVHPESDGPGFEVNGTVKIDVEPPEGSDLGDSHRELEVTSDTSITVILNEQVSVNGRVIEANGDPAVNDRIVVHGIEGTEHGAGTKTDTNGTFTTSVAKGGTYGVFYRQDDPETDGVFEAPKDGSPDIYAIDRFGNLTSDVDLGTIDLPTAHTLDIRVVDEAGNPIEGATVHLNHERNNIEAHAEGSVNQNGFLTLPGHNDTGIEVIGQIEVNVEPPDGSDFTEDYRELEVTDETTITVTLKEQVSVNGRLVTADGDPVANDHVAVKGIDGTESGDGTKTNTNGTFTANVVKGGTYGVLYRQDDPETDDLLEAPKDGSPDIYAIDRFNNLSSDVDLGTIDLPTAHTLDIRVVDEAGNPIEGATIHIEHVRNSIGAHIKGSSNGNGFLTLPGHDDTGLEVTGQVEIGVEPPGGSDFGEDYRELEVTDNKTITITLNEQVSVTGTVFESNGNPAVDDHIEVDGIDGTESGDDTKTDANGTFTASVAEGGSYKILYRQDDPETGGVFEAPKDGSPDIFAIDRFDNLSSDIDLGAIDLPTAHTLDVRVIDENGESVEGATVHLNHVRNNIETYAKGSSNGNGFLTLPGHNDTGIEVIGQIKIGVEPPDRSDLSEGHRELEVTNDTTVTITLTEQVSVNGRLVTADGDPAVNDHVVVHGIDGTESGDSTKTEANGTFTANVAKGGTYGVFYRQDDPETDGVFEAPKDGSPDIYAIDRFDNLSSDIDLGTIDLPTAHTLDIRVVDEAGNPVKDATVHIVHQRNNAKTHLQGVANENGFFELQGHDDIGIEVIGQLKIHIEPPDRSDLSEGHRELEVTNDTTVTITLTEQVSVNGRVIEADGDPAVNDRIGVDGIDGTESGDGTKTNTNGTFTANVAKGGTYGVFYWQDDPETDDLLEAPKDGSPDVFAIDRFDNLSSDVDLGTIDLPTAHTLDVRVIDENGEPVEGATVRIDHERNNITAYIKGLANQNGFLTLPGHDDTGLEVVGQIDIDVEPPEGSDLGDSHRELEVTSDTSITVTLNEQVSVNGRLVTADGDPAVNDHVVVHGIDGTESGDGTKTNTNGTFTANVAKGGTYGVFYWQDDPETDGVFEAPKDGSPDIYAIDRFDNLSSDVDFGTIDLPTAHTLDIRVVDSAGNPIEGATIHIEHVRNSIEAYVKGSSNGNGFVRLPGHNDTGLEVTGQVEIDVEPPEGSDLSEGDRELEVTNATTITVTLKEQVSVTGTVFENDGDPAARDTIHLDGREDTQLHAGEGTTTNEGGEFTVRGIQGGTFDIEYIQDDQSNKSDVAYPTDGSPDVFAVTRLHDVRRDIDIGDIQLPEAHLLNVKVVDSNGDPIENATVNIGHIPTDKEARAWANAPTTANGLMKHPQGDDTGIEVVGQTRIHVDPPSDSDLMENGTSVTVTDQRTVTITLREGIPVTGEITESDGDPAVDDIVAILADGPPPVDGMKTNTTGGFSLSALADTPQDLVYLQTHPFLILDRPLPAGEVPFRTDGSPDIYALTWINGSNPVRLNNTQLPEAYPLNVTVVDETGDPVTGARIELTHRNPDTPATTSYAATSNPNGKFEVNASDGPGFEVVGEINIEVQPPENDSRFANTTITRTLTVTEPTAVEVTLQSSDTNATPPGAHLNLSTRPISIDPDETANVSMTLTNTGNKTVELPAVTLDDFPAEWSIVRVQSDGGTISTDQTQVIYNEIQPQQQRSPTWTIQPPEFIPPGTYTMMVNLSTGGNRIRTATVTITVERPGVTAGFSPDSVSERPGSTTTIGIEISEFTRDIGTYEFNATVNDTNVATITGVELVGASLRDLGVERSIASDGSGISVTVPDGDHDNGVIARLTLETQAAGTARLTISDLLVGDRNFTEYQIAETTSAVVQVSERTAPPPVIGTQQPTDPDGDGKFEDITGDGQTNILDVGAFLQSRQNDTVQNNIDAFDFTGDGTVNILDVGKLLQQVVGS